MKDLRKQRDLLATAIHPLTHLVAEKDYPEMAAILEDRGRTIEAIDESDPIYAKITDSTGTIHKIARPRFL